MYTNMSESNIMEYVNNLFSLLCLISLPYPIFLQFFNWIALGDVALYFSFMLVRKANGVQEETK